MAETQDKENKPKATLIKHQNKDKASDSGNGTEEPKKKVVKKKVVLKRKPQTKDKKDEPEKTPGSTVESPGENKDRPRSTGNLARTRGSNQAGSAPRSDKRSSGPRKAGNLAGPKKPTYRRQSNERQGSDGEQRRDFRGKRSDGQGNNFRSDNRQRTGRPPRPGQSGQQRSGSRPGQSPRGGGRAGQSGGGSAPPVAEEKKSASKKFYKAKKKDHYQKKDKYQERDIQLKQKKNVPKANPIPKEIDIMEVITVSELARKMNLKASDLIGKLMGMGMMVTINQQIDADTATILAEEYNCKVNIVSLYDETLIESGEDKESDLEPRAPIVTVMGHVDHGKTKLLDAIRSTDVVADESGGITQHIGAYQVETESGKITFIDTPGHEAFTLMRARGAQVTDLVILVVAANDGVMPQTVEAISHAQAAEVPIIVAVNKVDLPDANIERVKQQLSEYNLLAEDWGGTTIFSEVSALKRQGIEALLESVLLEAEVLELKANKNRNAEGKIIESKIDPGRGTVSTVIIERGTLKIGDSFVAGVYHGKVRAMFNDKGEQVKTAEPSTPVEILGFTGIPDAGDPFQVTENERMAKQVGEKRQELKKVEIAQNVKKITLDNLYDSIQDGDIQELKVIIKGDVQGSVEAIKNSLEKLSTREIRLNAILASAGAINENDVNFASAYNAIIIGFHVRPTPRAQLLAEQEKVEIRKYSIIYDVVEDVRSAMEGMLSPDIKEEQIGVAEVRETFKVPKIGTIAGCMVTNGKVRRNAHVHLIREGIEIFTGPISSLRRFKDDAKEVDTNFECGIGLENWTDIKVGDIMEAFEFKEIAKKLGKTLEEEKKEAKNKESKEEV